MTWELLSTVMWQEVWKRKGKAKKVLKKHSHPWIGKKRLCKHTCRTNKPGDGRLRHRQRRTSCYPTLCGQYNQVLAQIDDQNPSQSEIFMDWTWQLRSEYSGHWHSWKGQIWNLLVDGASVDSKVDKMSSAAAFVWLDICESFDNEFSYIFSVIAATNPKINRRVALWSLKVLNRVVFNRYVLLLWVSILTCTLRLLHFMFLGVIWNVKSDGWHSKQVNLLFKCVNCDQYHI